MRKRRAKSSLLIVPQNPPQGRVSVCYDCEGLESRKEHKLITTAIGMAAAMGIELLTEDQYLHPAKAGRVRLENLKLGENPSCDPESGRRVIYRMLLWAGLCGS
jgi:hypothetical protein